MFKRITSIILLAAMLTATMSCGSDTETAETTAAVTEEVGEVYPSGIEPKEYNLTFNVLYPQWQLYKDSFFCEEVSTDRLPMALYTREVKVEDYLGVTITNTPVPTISDVRPALVQNVMAGDDEYQMVFTHCITDNKALITEGMLLDVNELNGLDLTADYWNQKSNENLAVGGKQYFFTGDYNLATPTLVLFNKDMIKEYNLEDPYQLVRDGEWTVDKMMEMMSAVTQDNGDTKWDKNDQYGFGCPNDWFLTSFLYSCGLTLTTQNDEGEFQFNMNNERVYDVCEKLQKLIQSPDTYCYNYRNDYLESTTAPRLNMSTGQVLFNLCCSSNLGIHRETDVDFGILPYPKLNEQQENYYALDWAGLMCVPSTVREPDMVGEVIELLAYHSAEEVIPAYYEIVLGTKLARDAESYEMLELIFDNIIFDAGMNYFGFDTYFTKFWSLANRFVNTVWSGNPTWSGYASYLAKYEQGALLELEVFNEEAKYLD